MRVTLAGTVWYQVRVSQPFSLTLDQLEALGEALLDFTASADLVTWLQENQAS